MVEAEPVSPSRRFSLVSGLGKKAWLRLAGMLLHEYGLSLAEIGRHLEIITSAVSKMVSKPENNLSR
jgi:hypothetical protein